MLDSLLALLDGDINYTSILLLLLIYILSIWLILTLWVFLDSKKRFKSFFWPIIFTVFVLPLNFPIFVLYLIIRPELEDENVVYLKGGSDHLGTGTGGVNIPVVNFIGTDGEIILNLGLKISKNHNTAHDLKVNVDWVSENKLFEKQVIKENINLTPSTKPVDEFSLKREFAFWKQGTKSIAKKAKNFIKLAKRNKKKTEAVFTKESAPLKTESEIDAQVKQEG